MSDDNGQVIQEDNSEPTAFAMIPQMAIMELDPYELALYCNYKITARDAGACWKSNATVAMETGMSESKMRQTRLALVAKGYIQLVEQTDEKGNNNAPPVITIVNIWSENRAKYGGVPENRGVAPQNTPPATRKHQSISNELDESEVEKKKENPLPLKKGKRQKVTNPDMVQENERINAVIQGYVKGLSIVPASNQYGNKTTRRAALDVSKAGYTPEQVETYTRHVQCQDYWKGKKPPLTTIAEGIAAYYAAHKPKPVFPIPEGHYDPALDDGTPATLEQIQQAKAMFEALVKSKSGNSEVRS